MDFEEKTFSSIDDERIQHILTIINIYKEEIKRNELEIKNKNTELINQLKINNHKDILFYDKENVNNIINTHKKEIKLLNKQNKNFNTKIEKLKNKIIDRL